MLLTTDNFMGRITTTLVVTNRVDQALASRGFIATDQVRSITLDNVLVDTGATTLCLSSEVIAQLGLELLKQVDVETATGLSFRPELPSARAPQGEGKPRGRARIFRDATISLLGREGTFECLELPGSQDALLGVIPLEALGVELDLQSQGLNLLPIGPDQSYLTIL